MDSKLTNATNFKYLKLWIMIAAAILCSGVITACAAPHDDTPNLYGYYEFQSNVYTNPLSSFLAVKGYMPYFQITENALMIIDNNNGTAQEFGGVFEKVPLTKEDFESLFDMFMGIGIPDISQYRECHQYAVFTTEGAPEYRLYVMDGQVWLAALTGSKRMWSIYNLVKIDGINTPGRPDGWQENVMPKEGILLEVCSGDSVSDTVVLTDEESVSTISKIIGTHSLKSARSSGVDVETVGDYFRFYDIGDANKAIYYAFSNEVISDEPQIQIGKKGGDYVRAAMPKEQYESLYALWESQMALPKAVIVTSGHNSAAALVFRSSAVKIPEVKEQLLYVRINPIDDYCPFRVYAEGVQKYGLYEIYDAETFEKLDFIRPSGLEPQTYILQNAVSGRSYIIEMSTGYSVGNRTYGAKILFGVTLP